MAPPRAQIALSGLFLSVFLGMLDAQVVATALPSIAGEFGGTGSYTWVTTAYLLSGSVTAPVHGKLGDLFGHKRVLLTALGLFLLGSLACALAPSAALLIAARVLQGAGSGGLFVCVGATLGELFSPREGAKYFGWFSVCFAVASLTGPVFGGVLADTLGWRWIFLLTLPPGLLALAAVARFLDLPPRQPRGAKLNVLPRRLFKDRTFTVASALSVLSGFAFLGSINYLAVYLQNVAGAAPAKAGLLLVPMTLAVAVSSVVAGRVISRTGRYRWAPIASMALGLAAVAAMTTLDEHSALPVVVACLALFGLAAGLNLQVLALATQNTAPREDLGVVSAAINLARSLGSALGPVVLGLVFTAGLPNYATASHGVFLALLVPLALGLATAFALPHVPLRTSR